MFSKEVVVPFAAWCSNGQSVPLSSCWFSELSLPDSGTFALPHCTGMTHVNSVLAIVSLFLPSDESAFQKYWICWDFEVAKIWIIFYLPFYESLTGSQTIGHLAEGKESGVQGGTKECGRNLWKMGFEGPLLWRRRGLDLPTGPSSWWSKPPQVIPFVGESPGATRFLRTFTCQHLHDLTRKISPCPLSTDMSLCSLGLIESKRQLLPQDTRTLKSEQRVMEGSKSGLLSKTRAK